MPRDSNLDAAGFERRVTLREAYRIMEKFVTNYHSRGDTPVSDFLFAYAAVARDGLTTDPAAAADFLQAATVVLDRRDDERAR